ncbi:hypothetical protein H6P81_002797 [Aristolochia fimbriata]|uniref:Uncharacterized protein n=1 Tax=Aristolochia fimbriata TaxID=158543 RepID=A0AAV7FCJ6_ARIFI|nr:hypothetical protein H6P81_002797 [Aristolochia fimbriata]
MIRETPICDLEVQLGQLASAILARSQGTLPSNSEGNPKEQVKAITLKSGKVLERPKQKQVVEEEVQPQQPEIEKEEEVSVQPSVKEPKWKREEGKSFKLVSNDDIDVNTLPNPEKAKRDKVESQFSKFIEISKKLEINIPLEALMHMPQYTKFLQRGRPFLATIAALIDVKQRKFTLRLNEEEIVFNIKQAIKRPSNPFDDICYFTDICDECVENFKKEVMIEDSLEIGLDHSCTKEEKDPLMQCELEELEAEHEEEMEKEAEANNSSKLELKPLPRSLKYVYLGDESNSVIISTDLDAREE